MTVKQLYSLHEKEQAKVLTFQGCCVDCNKTVVVTSTITEQGISVEGGAVCDIERNNNPETFVVKCADCYAKPEGKYFGRKCEVYSRVVGYLRPIKQWNKGKQAEWDHRVAYDAEKAIREAS